LPIENVKRTTQISSNVGRGCEHCGYAIGSAGREDLSDGINHFIEVHGYRLLHVGTDTDHGRDGKVWHNTVAVLGHDNPPPIAPPVKIVFSNLDSTHK
jgi:hypothetical protein